MWHSPSGTSHCQVKSSSWLAGPHALEEANSSLHPAKAYRGAGSDRDCTLGIGDKHLYNFLGNCTEINETKIVVLVTAKTEALRS